MERKEKFLGGPDYVEETLVRDWVESGDRLFQFLQQG
jgi:hypothetical protein